jgi:hypothetical protein
MTTADGVIAVHSTLDSAGTIERFESVIRGRSITATAAALAAIVREVVA